MPVTTRSQNSPDMSTTIQKQKTATPVKEKIVSKKSKTTQTDSIPLDPPTASKTLVVLDTLEYNIVEDMKNTRANISLRELTKCKQQQRIILRELKTIPISPLSSVVVTQAAYDMRKPPSSSNKVNPSDLVLIGDSSISHTPPFLLTYEIFNRNVHNFLVDSRASSNIMPRTVCTKLDITPQKSIVHIFQLDITKVEVLGERASV